MTPVPTPLPPPPLPASADAKHPTVWVAGNELQVFLDSESLMKAFEADIRQAKTRVWLESYIISNDDAGQAIAEALMERARAGVDVRVMVDAVGSWYVPPRFFHMMERAGVQVHVFHGLSEALSRFRFLRVLNRRNHRKLLIIDDRVGYFGGMNIVDLSGITTIQEAKAKDLPYSAGWRDTHVRLVGPALPELAMTFDRLWRRVHRQKAPRAPRWQLAEMLANPADGIYFFDTRPAFRHRRAARIFVQLIRRARRSITLLMAYFIPMGPVIRALLKARRRGVRVRVVIPGENDVKLVGWAARHYYAKLLRRGIRIYERKDNMLHSKVMVIDDEWSVIGSSNLDPRSLLYNLEFQGVIRSRDMNRLMKRVCADEIRQSRRVTLKDVAQRKWTQRLLDRLAWSVRWWL